MAERARPPIPPGREATRDQRSRLSPRRSTPSYRLSITTPRSPSPPARSCWGWARRLGPARPVASSLGESRRRGDRSVPTALDLNRTLHNSSRGLRGERSEEIGRIKENTVHDEIE